MLPRPDDRAWSKQNGQKDPMIHFAREEDFRSAEGALRLLWNITGNEYAERAWKNRWAFRPRNHAKQSSPSTEEMEDDGPFDIKLPYAPSMQVYCLYGVGKATEKGYEYMWQPNNKEQPLRINTSAHDPSIQLQNGVYLGDGDGTVPLMSLGYMCNKGWRSARYNPAGIRIVTREYQHNPVHFLQDLRGGPLSGDHVDILLNEEMIDDLLTITGGDGDQLQDAIYSEIRELSQGFEL